MNVTSLVEDILNSHGINNPSDIDPVAVTELLNVDIFYEKLSDAQVVIQGEKRFADN